jgi:hypothetical protein
MTEFEKSKQRYEKRIARAKAKVIHIEKPALSIPDSVEINIVDSGKEYHFRFSLESIKSTRFGAQRSEQGYREIIEQFVKKEFGRWRSLQSP